MTQNYQKIKSPVGELVLVASEDNLRAVVFGSTWAQFRKKFSGAQEKDSTVLKQTKKQLADYFQGKRRDFDLPLDPEGTAFQKKVWKSLTQIPYGQTRTYGQQAASLKCPTAVRAVGRTNGLNPLCIVLPCHRVVGANGQLTGYAGGLKAKRFLLQLEKN